MRIFSKPGGMFTYVKFSERIPQPFRERNCGIKIAVDERGSNFR